MSSTAYPFGMIPTQQLAAGVNSQGFNAYPIEDGEATSIFNGDVVEILTTGYIEKDVGTTTLTPIGVFIGASYVDPSLRYFLNSNFWPGGTTSGVTTGQGRPLGYVVDDPNAVFMIQADGTLTQAALGANAAIVQTAGSATSSFGRSRNALSASSVDVTPTLPLRIVGLAELPDNAWGDAYPIVLVKFNNHQLTNTTGI